MATVGGRRGQRDALQRPRAPQPARGAPQPRGGRGADQGKPGLRPPGLMPWPPRGDKQSGSSFLSSPGLSLWQVGSVAVAVGSPHPLCRLRHRPGRKGQAGRRRGSACLALAISSADKTSGASLSGPQQSLQQSCPDSPVVILRDVQTLPKASPTGRRKPETTRLITKDSVRDLIIPAESPAASLVMGQKDFQRIKEAARVLTKEEREAKLAALRAEKEAVLEAVSERKSAAKQKAALQQQAGKLSELEEVAQERARHLVQRASRMRMEQEDEIREFSELILGAKCHMIRDAQILEKQLIARELEEEEKRLARMMEVERKRADEMQEELERRRKQELLRGRQELVKQIEQNAEERALRAEQRDQEAQEVREYLEQLKMEDLKDLERRQEQQKKIQAEIKRINDENQKRKEEQREQERMADEQVLEYQRQKMEREAKFEAEQERIRWEKEKETERLRAMQERAQDHQAEQDALRAKRSQEAAEREWRRKEKEAAQKKAKMEQVLKRSRLEQVAQREHSMAVQVQQDRHEFERMLRAQQEQMEKEAAEEARRAGLQLAHAHDVRCQMQERQQQLARERVAAFQECQRLEEEARQRSQRIAQLKQQKMQELRAAGIPEKYCAQVERRARSLTRAAPGQAQPREEQGSGSPLT
ncbi:cilia- and flagella-associated protein 45 isoform X2 [Athene noctua]|uniref:cilia- and flagella-associated protein 45 isoform X2 n=1 Tax=Athene noctua TaxID=126797 RepID=UPI003EC09D32